MALFEALRHGSQLILTVILARLLSPTDFGLIGMAMILIGLLDSVSELGIKASLVQKKESITSHLDTAWTIQLLRGIILFLCISLTAPLVAKFFREPLLNSIIPVLALKPVLVGLNNPAAVNFVRELEFRKQFMLQMSGVILRLFLVIPLAFLLKNVWVLVIGNLSVSGGRMITSYLMYPYRPKLNFNLKKASEMFNFGKWLLGAQFIHIIARTVPSTIIGRLMDTASLGIYRIADQFGILPAFVVRQITGKVLFPAYAKLQEDVKRLRNGYRRVLGLVGAIMIPLSIGGFVLRQPIVHHILGPKWDSVANPLGILFLAGGIQMMVQTSYPVFMGIGSPRITFWLRAVSTLILIVSIFPLFLAYGIEGVALSVLIGHSFAVPFWIFMINRFIQFKLMDIVKTLLPIFMAAVLMSMVVAKFNQIMSDNVLGLLFLIFMGASVFLIVMVGFWKIFKTGPVEELVSYIEV